MTDESNDILNKDFIIENLTRTLLYEGYSLFPYYRNAIKNQKPIPFGVVYPTGYHAFNEHSHCEMVTDCIVFGDKNVRVNVSVRFLHLIKTEIFQKGKGGQAGGDFTPVFELNFNSELYQSGWQTIERTISSGDIPLVYLAGKRISLPFSFDKKFESEDIYNENAEIAGRKITSISKVEGTVVIKVIPLENMGKAFRVIVFINNNTPVADAQAISRDDVFKQSFLSTNTILNAINGEFISLQNPSEKWAQVVEQCKNKDTWPVLIDENNTTLLSSPIIVYDYPKINPKSKGDLFDSLEIEEALMLHFSVMSDAEKQKIAQSDEKLRAMLSKVSQVTPEEIINLHGGFSDILQPKIHNNKEKEL